MATFSLPWVLEANDFPLPHRRHADLAVRLRRQAPPRGQSSPSIRDTTFGEMGINESSLDGPPVQDPEIWIPLHRTYWNGLLSAYGRECTDDMPVLVEPFDYIGEFT